MENEGTTNAPETKPQEQQAAPTEPYLGTWKDKAAAEEGVGNMQAILDSQGTELGALRQQSQMMMQQMDDMQNQANPEPVAPAGPDYEQEMQGIQKQIGALDPDDPGYQVKLGQLVMASNKMAADQSSQNVLAMAQAEFGKVLNERDVQTAHKDFYRDNPDFNTPEMQMRIQEHLTKDRTGMGDTLTAYREIQRDDALAAAKTLTDENAEIKRLLDLKKGEESTGKVVTKGQSPQQSVIKQPKATGAALTQGMHEALNKFRA